MNVTINIKEISREIRSLAKKNGDKAEKVGHDNRDVYELKVPHNVIGSTSITHKDQKSGFKVDEYYQENGSKKFLLCQINSSFWGARKDVVIANNNEEEYKKLWLTNKFTSDKNVWIDFIRRLSEFSAENEQATESVEKS